MFRRLTIAAWFIALFCVFVSFKAAWAQPLPHPKPPNVTAQTQTPGSRTVAHADPQHWWEDPRWWGIVASGLLGLASLVTQFAYRISDRNRDARAELFDAEIGDAVRETYKELRSLNVAVKVACDIADLTARGQQIIRVQQEVACKALTIFSLALLEADHRLETKGAFSDVNADLEDEFYEALSQVGTANNITAIQAAARRASTAIVSAISNCDKLLRTGKACRLANQAFKNET